VGFVMGLRSRLTHLRPRLDLLLLDWPPRRGPRFRMWRSFAEAAQVLSRHLTEPMRGSPPSPPTCAALDAAEPGRLPEPAGTAAVTTLPDLPSQNSTSCPESEWRGGGPREGSSCRLAWTAPGTERFLGRALRERPRGEWTCGITISVELPLAIFSESEESRRRAGTREGLTPYSCLAPPRFNGYPAKTTELRTTVLEPSRRRSERFRSV
jgi:hypothetical protein